MSLYGGSTGSLTPPPTLEPMESLVDPRDALLPHDVNLDVPAVECVRSVVADSDGNFFLKLYEHEDVDFHLLKCVYDHTGSSTFVIDEFDALEDMTPHDVNREPPPKRRSFPSVSSNFSFASFSDFENDVPETDPCAQVKMEPMDVGQYANEQFCPQGDHYDTYADLPICKICGCSCQYEFYSDLCSRCSSIPPSNTPEPMADLDSLDPSFFDYFDDSDFSRYPMQDGNTYCPVCGCELFNDSIVRHLRAHQGVVAVDMSINDKYHCDLCGLRFKYRSNLIKHWRDSCRVFSTQSLCMGYTDEATVIESVAKRVTSFFVSEEMIMDYMFPEFIDCKTEASVLPTVESHLPNPMPAPDHSSEFVVKMEPDDLSSYTQAQAAVNVDFAPPRSPSPRKVLDPCRQNFLDASRQLSKKLPPNFSLMDDDDDVKPPAATNPVPTKKKRTNKKAPPSKLKHSVQHKCNICEVVFYTQVSLAQHYGIVHSVYPTSLPTYDPDM